MLTFGKMVQRNGLYWGGKDAFVERDRRITWSEFDRQTDALGRALRSLGILPGDRVAIVSSDCIEVAEHFIACAKIGAVRVGFNPRLAVAEINALIADCTPRVLIVNAEMDGIRLGALDKLKSPPVTVGFAGTHRCDYDYEELKSRNADSVLLEQTPHEIATITYTTGSTGLPKGAIYPHDKFVNGLLYTALHEGLTHDSVWLHTMAAAGIPLMHMMRNLFHASTTVIVGHWDPEAALALIERECVTNATIVPSMLNSLLKVDRFGRFDLSSMRLLNYGASPMPPAVIRSAIEAIGCPFIQMFGTTELMGMASMLFPSDHQIGLTSRPEILASAGRPVSYVDLRIVDGANEDVVNGEVGELLVRSETSSPGYWNAPVDESRSDGWIRTGDLAHRDSDGYLYLKDRLQFRMKSGGYNVFPTEVENVLANHPSIDEVSVFGLPDAQWGDRIEAVVTLKSGATVTGDQLREFCRGKIADYKVPKAIEIWPELPKGTTGKLLKRAIIERRLSETSRDKSLKNAGGTN